jgi:hypothetical protein
MVWMLGHREKIFEFFGTGITTTSRVSTRPWLVSADEHCRNRES